ncbi:MAG: beta-lactamase family protein [Silvanigrellaceae bacterium]|nr:beta-lactamase family protein [Silvanigrellaceae bacterium]
MENSVKKVLITLLLLLSQNMVVAETFQDLINHHLKQYSQLENFSAIQVSIKAGELKHYVAGTKNLAPGSAKITPTDLFDVGSITKSFTAALAVMAEADGKLQLNETVGHYLSEYPHWGNISLTGLLNMSTGIPNYSDSPTINYLLAKNLRQYWEPEELIGLAYPKQVNPPRKAGYFYSNTGYVLLDIILTKQYKMPFKQLLQDKIIKPLDLKNTFYPVPDYSKDVLDRLVHGYSYNIYDNPELLGQDVTENNLSWAGAAGAIVANSDDVVYWIENLFINDKILSQAQKNTIQKLISVSTGKSIKKTNSKDPRGFGLGIIQGYEPETGNYWFYEGKTLGYRAFYLYVPCNKVIIAALFNSATNSQNDHGGELMLGLYHEVVKQNETLVCKS